MRERILKNLLIFLRGIARGWEAWESLQRVFHTASKWVGWSFILSPKGHQDGDGRLVRFHLEGTTGAISPVHW